MAKDEAVEKLGELLKCSICLDTFNNPKLLHCSHVYCQDCLARLVVRGAGGGITLTCPTCRDVTPVPVRGVAGFQAEYRINDLKDIYKSLAVADNLAYCSEHADRELELYCETCDQLICFRCAYKGGGHHRHSHEIVERAFEHFKDTVRPALETTHETVRKLAGTIKKMLPHHTATGVIDHESVTYRHAFLRTIQANLGKERGKLGALLKLDKKRLSKREAIKTKTTISKQIEEAMDVMRLTFSKLDAPDPSLSRISGEERATVVRERTIITLHTSYQHAE